MAEKRVKHKAPEAGRAERGFVIKNISIVLSALAVVSMGWFAVTQAVSAASHCVCGFEDGRPVLIPIALDGNMSDWAPALADKDSNVCDGPGGGLTDADAPVQSTGRDLVRFTYTWNNSSFFGNTKRVGSTNNVDKFIYYADTNNNGRMESGEPVVVVRWQGSNRTVRVFVGTYAAANPAGDSLIGANGKTDGFAMPGTITNLPQQANYQGAWGSADGTEMEWRVRWTNLPTAAVEPGLGVAPGTPIQWHISSTNKEPTSANISTGIDDNMGGCGGCQGTTQFAAINFTPNIVARFNAGETVSLGHTLVNSGNSPDTFDISWAASTFSLTPSASPSVSALYKDLGVIGTFEPGIDLPLSDTNGDSKPDTGVMAPGQVMNIIARTVLPTPLAPLDAASITLAAASNFQPPCGGTKVTAAVIDSLTIKNAEVGIAKSASASSPFPGVQFTFSLSATDNGPDTASGLVVTDLLPAGLAYVSHVGNGTYNSGTGAWTIGNLASAQSATLTITVVAGTGSSGQSFTNTAAKSAALEADSNTANNSASATVNVGSLPVAADDTYVTNQGSSLSVSAPGILGNDNDPGSLALTAVVVSNPAHGSLTLNSNGSFTYTPVTSFSGNDFFTYKANNSIADSNIATVTITVTQVNLAPTATNDAFSVVTGAVLTVVPPGVLGNDADPNGDTLTAAVAVGPTHGTLSLAGNGGFTYTPAAGFSGNDSFTYRASDGSLQSNVATVNLTVSPANLAPNAVGDSFATSQNTPLVVSAPGVLGNDADPNGDTLTAAVVAGPTHGTLALAADGGFTYTPTAGFSGSDAFTYQATDGNLLSAVTTAVMAVTSANSAPTAAVDAYSIPQNTTLSVPAPGVLVNDADPDDDTLTATLITGPANGNLTFNSNGAFEYVPVPFFSGTDSFTYQAVDGALTSGTVTVTISVIAPPSGGGSGGQIAPIDVAVGVTPSTCTATRNVQLLLHALNASSVKISHDPDFAGADWQAFSSTAVLDWELPDGDGQKTFYVVFMSPYSVESDTATATVLLDEAGKCSGENTETATEETPASECRITHSFTKTDVDLYIVTPDGVERHTGSEFVKTKKLSLVSTEFDFEDRGTDQDFDDVVLRLDSVGTDQAFVHVLAVNASLFHRIGARLIFGGEVLDDLILWDRAAPAVGGQKAIDLNKYTVPCGSKPDIMPRPGDLIKGVGEAVYYFDRAGKRRVFPNRKTFMSWYPDFSTVKPVSERLLLTIPEGPRVTYRPGVRLVKSPLDRRVYAVDAVATLRWAASDEVASALYGSGWRGKVDDIGPSFLSDYVLGAPIAAAADFDPGRATASVADIESLTMPVGERVPTVSCASSQRFTVNLALGSRHSSVLPLQRLLRCLGYIPESFSPTGLFGRITAAGGRGFQTDYGLAVTGSVDLKTREALNLFAD